MFAAGVLAALIPHIVVAEPLSRSSPLGLSADRHGLHDELLADQRDADNLNELNIIGAAEGVPLPTEADMLARYAQWEQRVAAGNPATWEEQIRQHRRAKSATGKRQLQHDLKNWDLDTLGDLPVDNFASVLDQHAAVQIAAGRTNAPTRCDDPLASNTGSSTSCTYECSSLTDQYFPGEDADTTCFIFDPATNQWPHSEFMATKSTMLLWNIFVDESPATEPIGFMVGAGPVCNNVTVQTSSLSPDAEDSVEVICLLEGVHEHVHEHPGQAVLVTVDSGARVLANETQADAGDTSLFTNGECEDVLFRFDATDGDSDVVWTLNDAGHNGPWTITSSFSSSNRDEHFVCLFDNNFTLSRPANSNWAGTVTVATYVEDNTIRLNNHGNYIVHGTEINGVPSTLDARLQSGSLPASQCHQDEFYDRCVAEAGGEDGLGISTANFVLRYVRWTGLKAPLDPYAPARMHSMRAPVRLGGGFYFIGGWGSSITFDHCVFDHMLASSGAGFYIDGEMDEWARTPEVRAMTSHEQRAEHAETVRMTLTISDCLFWEMDAGWVGGGARVIDVWPLQLTIQDSQFMNNNAIVSSAINYAIYSKSFDSGTGIHGDTRTFLKRVEVAENQATSIRYTDPPRGRLPDPDENRLHWGGKRYHQQPMHWVAFGGHWEESENWALSVDIEDYYTHDIRNSQQPGITFYNIGRCNCGCQHVSLRDSRIENSKGDFDSQYQGAAFLNFGQTVEIERTRFIDNGADSPAMNSAATGIAVLRITDWGRVQNSEFINGEASSGGAILFETTGWLEIRDTLFRSNTGYQGGAAITHSAVYDPTNLGIPPPDIYSLMVINCIFDSNTVPQNQEGKTVEIIVYLYTGITGTGPGQVAGNSDNELLPVWKIDGSNPNEFPSPAGCRDPPEQTTWVLRSGSWRSNSPRQYLSSGEVQLGCQDGSVPSTETVYGNLSYPIGSFQSEVVTVTVGSHRLWHGVIANNPFIADSWGDGYIAILDVLPPTPVKMFDNRAQQDDNGVIRQEGCATNPRSNPEECPPLFDRKDPTYSDCVNYCRDGETFWSYTDFHVPYGAGGGINVQAAAEVLIADSIFTNNIAGKGTAVSVASADRLTVTNTTYVEADVDGTGETGPGPRTVYVKNPLTQDECSAAPCRPGFSCEFSMFSLRCDPCEFNQIGTDGIRCTQCTPGTEPNADNTECIPCENGKRSSRGFCEDCEAGKTSADDRITCVDCVDAVRASHEPECRTCEAGKSPSPGKTTCAPCYQPGAYSVDGIACETCANGEQPNVNRTGCDPCPAATAGTNGVCEPCSAGTEPSDDGILCQACPPGRFGRDGSSCDRCDPGSAPNAGAGADSCALCEPGSISQTGENCVPCPERQTPSSDRTACFCMANTYNQQVFGPITCDGFFESTFDSGLADTCASCPVCLDCDAGSTELKPGWAFFGHDMAYQCPVPEGCPGGQLLNKTVSRQLWSKRTGTNYDSTALDSQCAIGYSGPICGDCADEYHHLKVGRPCLTCEEGLVDVPALIGMVFAAIILGGVLVSGAYKVLVDHGVVTDLRLLVGFYQILGQMDNVLNISFPSPVPEFIRIVSLLFVDIRKFVNLDCWDMGGFVGKLTTNVFAIPILFAGGCFLYYLNERRTIGTVIAAGGADASAYRTATVSLQQNIFFCIFLLYPTITATLFRVPQCRVLGDREYHEEDFTIDCETGEFYFWATVSIGLIVAIPIGVPAIFLFLMNRARLKLPGGKVNSNLLGGAKLVPDTLDDDKDTYGFLCRDCKPKYWYYEIVTYARKLLLGGLTIAVGRGTMAQGYFVAACEAAFLMHHMRVYPYVRPQHNIVDAIGHLALVLTYTIALILRNNEAEFVNESFPKEGYGWFLVFLYAVVLPAPTVYYFFSSASESSKEGEERYGDSGSFENPLVDGDIDRDENSDTLETMGIDSSGTAISVHKLAKMQREVRETLTENQELKRQNAALLAKASDAGVDLGLATTAASEMTITSASALDSTAPKMTAEEIKINKWKQLAEDEYLNEETRAAAKANIEQMHALELALANTATAKSFERREVNLETALAPSAAARQEFRNWLGKNRLLQHESKIAELCGQYVAVDDFALLDQEDLDAITSVMTKVEAARFVAAVRAQAAQSEEN